MTKQFGYGGAILSVNLTTGYISEKPSGDYVEKFIGGRGLAARLFWELAPPEAKALDPENCLVCASGPVAGFAGLAGFRWQMCARTPMGNPEYFSYANLGEKWGATLKYAGYDALAVTGASETSCYILVSEETVEIRDATHLKGLSTFSAMERLKSELGAEASVLTIGPAAENLLPFSTVFSEGGASGSGGMGAAMGAKNLKAIVVIAKRRRPEAADMDQVKRLVSIMRKRQPKEKAPSIFGVEGLTKDHMCYGCGLGCSRLIYDMTGKTYKAFCQSSNLYIAESTRHNGARDGSHLLATRLCDSYGLDTSVMWTIIHWLDGCYQEGILDEATTGLPLSQIGSATFIEALTRQLACRDGFCGRIADGFVETAMALGASSEAVLRRYVATRWGDKKDYDARTTLTTSLFYAVEPRRPIQQLHEIVTLVMAFVGMGGNDAGKYFTPRQFRQVAAGMWGGEIAADFSTYEGKARAAKLIQDRVYFKESMVMCDLFWTATQISRVLNPEEEPVTEKEIYAAITGRQISETELSRIGERIFNLQRAILLRQGWNGRADDTLMDYLFHQPLTEGETFFNPKGLMPGKNGDIISRVGSVVEKEAFETMKTEYYRLRGWDTETGHPTYDHLLSLDLGFVADDLVTRGMIPSGDR